MWTSGTGSLKKTSRVQVHDTWQCLIALIASSKVGARQISRLIRLEICGDPCCSIELPFSEPPEVVTRVCKYPRPRVEVSQPGR